MTQIDMDIQVAQTNGITIISIYGELDDFQAPKLHHTFSNEPIYSQTGIIIDLSNTSFVDSVGLGVIVAQAKLLKKDGIRTVLVVTTPQIIRLLNQTGITTSQSLSITVTDSVAGAITLLSE